jgi:type I restriction enzyme S subunit
MRSTISLGDIATLHDAERIPLNSRERMSRKGKYPYYGASGIVDHIDDYLFDGEYVLISEDGENLRSRKTPIAFKATGKFWVNNHAHIVKGKEPWLNDFIVSYFQYLDASPYISGAVQPKLNQQALLSIPIIWPGEKRAKEITEVLSSFDKKIELNRRMNATLEAIGQALFKHWFVDNPEKENWPMQSLSEIADISIGRTPPRKETRWFSLNPSDMKWVSIKDMGNSGIFIDKTSEYLTEEAVDKFNIPIIPKNTLILSFKLTVGRLAITVEKMLSNEAIAHFRLKNKFISNEYLYYYLNNFDFTSIGSTSSIATAVNSQMIKNIKILIPNQKMVDKFNNLIRPNFEKIKNNQQQVEILSHIRDSLLPRLMSGRLKT